MAYRPFVTQPGPVVLCGGQAYTLQGSLAIPAVGDVNIYIYSARVIIIYITFKILLILYCYS